MLLSEDNIYNWYSKYNESIGMDNIIESSILGRIDNIKTFEDFKNLILNPKDGILKWKLALRTKNYYDSLDNSNKWRDLFEITGSSINNPKETVKKITTFSKENMYYKRKNGAIYKGGISYPVASTIVYFFSKGNCPIIDWRAILTLKESEYRDELKGIYSDKGWDAYYVLCNKIVSKYNIKCINNDTPLRVLDKALWVYPAL